MLPDFPIQLRATSVQVEDISPNIGLQWYLLVEVRGAWPLDPEHHMTRSLASHLACTS